MVTLAFWLGIAWAAPPTGQLTIEGVRPARLKAGEAGMVVVEASIRAGFHVQANPASMPTLIPTKVTLPSAQGIEVGRPVYPKSEDYKIAGLKTAVATYSGKIEFQVPLTATSAATPGKKELDGDIRYQACDDKVCFPPTRAVFKAPVEIVR